MSQCFQPLGVSTLPLGFWRWTSGIVLLAFDFWRGALAFGFALVLALGFWHLAFGIGFLALGFWRWGFGVGLFTLGFPRLGFLALSGLLSLASGFVVAPACRVGDFVCTGLLARGGPWVFGQTGRRLFALASCAGFWRWLLALTFGPGFWLKQCV